MLILHVIDDEESLCDDFTEMLEDLPDIQITTFSEPQGFLDSVFHSSEALPDVVFVDHDLKHVINGVDVIGSLRKSGLEIPIVLMTGHIDQNIAFRAAQQGATIFVRKEDLIDSASVGRAIDDAIRLAFAKNTRSGRNSERAYHGVVSMVREFVHDTEDIFNFCTSSASMITKMVGRLRDECGDSQDLSVIEDEAQRISDRGSEGSSFLEHLSEFTGSGKVNISYRDCNFSDLLNTCISTYLSSKRKVFINNGVRDICIDESALRRIFKVIFVNIEEHLSENEQVWVESKLENILGNRVLRIILKDNGPGIPDEVRPFVFLPGICGTHTQKSHGLGLGLAQAKRLVEAHRVGEISGKIWCAANAGEGTSFVIQLPINEGGIGEEG